MHITIWITNQKSYTFCCYTILEEHMKSQFTIEQLNLELT